MLHLWSKTKNKKLFRSDKLSREGRESEGSQFMSFSNKSMPSCTGRAES